jgi:hypothetical protein
MASMSTVKNCRVCHAPMPRRTYPSGRTETNAEYAKRSTCGRACGHALAAQTNTTAPARQEPCAACGGPVHRRPGELRQAWRARRTCSPTCTTKLRSLNAKKNGLHNDFQERPHPPCKQCGGPVERREGEGHDPWHRRLTCSEACRRERIRAAALVQVNRVAPPRPQFAAKRRPAKGRPARAPRAVERAEPIERRKAFERFPDPAGLRPAWVSVTGPDVGPPQTSHQGAGVNRLRSPEALEALASAVQAHPDFGTALTGALVDSWVPFNDGGTTLTSLSGRYT